MSAQPESSSAAAFCAASSRANLNLVPVANLDSDRLAQEMAALLHFEQDKRGILADVNLSTAAD